MATTTLKVVAGNSAPQFQITCQRDDGTIIDLTDCTVGHFLYRGSTQSNTGNEFDTVSIINAPSGIIGWQPKAGDFSGAGTFKGDIQITYSDTSVEVLYGRTQFKARARGTG